MVTNGARRAAAISPRSRADPPVGSDASRSGLRPSLFGGVDAQLTAPEPQRGRHTLLSLETFLWDRPGQLLHLFGSKAGVFRTLVNEVMETDPCAPRVPVTPAPAVAHRASQKPALLRDGRR
jgi:hypothetical protein